jgi:hypothetical protein
MHDKYADQHWNILEGRTCQSFTILSREAHQFFVETGCFFLPFAWRKSTYTQVAVGHFFSHCFVLFRLLLLPRLPPQVAVECCRTPGDPRVSWSKCGCCDAKVRLDGIYGVRNGYRRGMVICVLPVVVAAISNFEVDYICLMCERQF